jgi:hypothetical protein
MGRAGIEPATLGSKVDAQLFWQVGTAGQTATCDQIVSVGTLWHRVVNHLLTTRATPRIRWPAPVQITLTMARLRKPEVEKSLQIVPIGPRMDLSQLRKPTRRTRAEAPSSNAP